MWGGRYARIWYSYGLKQGIPLQDFIITNKTLSVVVLLLLSGSPTTEEHPVDSFDLDTHTHDYFDDGSTLSSQTEYKKVL